MANMPIVHSKQLLMNSAHPPKKLLPILPYHFMRLETFVITACHSPLFRSVTNFVRKQIKPVWRNPCRLAPKAFYSAKSSPLFGQKGRPLGPAYQCLFLLILWSFLHYSVDLLLIHKLYPLYYTISYTRNAEAAETMSLPILPLKT